MAPPWRAAVLTRHALILPLRRIPYTGESRKAASCAAAGSEPATDLPSRGKRSVQCRRSSPTTAAKTDDPISRTLESPKRPFGGSLSEGVARKGTRRARRAP
jgi:hypothetical protein